MSGYPKWGDAWGWAERAESMARDHASYTDWTAAAQVSMAYSLAIIADALAPESTGEPGGFQRLVLAVERIADEIEARPPVIP